MFSPYITEAGVPALGISRPRLGFPSPALIIACLALFAALGGGAYAATQTSASGIRFTNASLENGWTAGGHHSGPPGYAKDSLGVVHLRGSLATGSNDTVAFVLPRGLRPTHRLFLPAYGGEGLLINPNGEVLPAGPNVGFFTSLAGIDFPTSS
jgi:hypothetical protein